MRGATSGLEEGAVVLRLLALPRRKRGAATDHRDHRYCSAEKLGTRCWRSIRSWCRGPSRGKADVACLSCGMLTPSLEIWRLEVWRPFYPGSHLSHVGHYAVIRPGAQPTERHRSRDQDLSRQGSRQRVQSGRRRIPLTRRTDHRPRNMPTVRRSADPPRIAAWDIVTGLSIAQLVERRTVMVSSSSAGPLFESGLGERAASQ